MSVEPDSVQSIESDENNWDSSDELIELDSEDAESDHQGSLTLSANDGMDVRGAESEGSKQGLDSGGDKSNEICMTSTNDLASEGCLGSQDGSSVEGSATELAATKQLSVESDQKGILTKLIQTSTAKDGTDVPSLESQGHKLGLNSGEEISDEKCMSNNGIRSAESEGSKPGLDLGGDKSNEKCMMSTNGLLSEGCLGSQDGSSVEGSATEPAATNQLSVESGQKGILTKVSVTASAKDGTDVPCLESQGSKPGLDSGGDKSNEKCMMSTNSLASEGCLGSQDGSSVESEHKGSLTKFSLTASAKDGTDIPNLESQGHKPGLKSGKDKSDANCMMSDNGQASAGSLGSKDGSDVKKSVCHGSATELAASKQLSSERNRKRSLTVSVKDSKNVPSLQNKVKLDSGDDKSDQKFVTSSSGIGTEGSLESKDGPSVQGKEGNGSATEMAASKKSSSGNKGSKVNSEKKRLDRPDDAKKKSTSSSKEKKDESRSDKRNSKKRSQSRDRKGSSTKNRRSNEIPAKRESNTSRTKRTRSGSRHREDEGRKRRRTSKSRSRSRHEDHRSRTRETFDHERAKARQVSDILQSQIDRLKEEVEKARAELKSNTRQSRSRSSDRRDRFHSDRHSSPRLCTPVHYRSRSRSLDRVESSGSMSRRSPLPSVQRFLDASYPGNSEEKLVVVVKKVDVKDQSTRFKMLTKFRRYGEVLDSSFDEANKVAILHYKKLQCAEEAVKGMCDRYFEGEYLKVRLVNERDVELVIAENCSQCGKDHSPNECPRLTRRSHSRKRESRARSSSLELHWPAQPRHPSTNLFDQARNLSPLSLLMATESLRNGGIRPVVFQPKPLPTTLTISVELPLGAERLAKREMMMKKMNSVLKCDWGERSLSDFEILSMVGKGTYGQMYKAADKDLKLLMALKKVMVESDKNGFPFSALQEMKLLSRLDHPNIVKLVEILREDQENRVGAKKIGKFYFVYDYMNHDLKRLLQSKLLQLKSEDIAWFIKQLLSALSYCHRIGLVHRDVRPSNILINNRGELKLAQFGLACLYDEKAEPPASSSIASTDQRMVSLWYRAPELLLGEKKSSPATDVWSCGCVVGEIFSRKPIFLGSDEQHQIEVISKVCGTPSTSSWPNVTFLPLHYILKTVEDYPRLFHDAFHYVPYMARNLLDRLLVMDPAKRLTAQSALETDWLKDADFPKMLPMMLVNINDCHMLMPAKSPIESDVQNLPGVGKVSAVGLEDRKLESFAGSSFVGRTRREDVSDKVAITRSLGSTFVPEADTVWKSMWSSASRETTGVPVADVQVSRKPAEKPHPMSDQLSRRAFNPRVTDYACQPTYAKPAPLPEKPVLQREKPYVGSSSMHSVNIDDRTQVAAEKSLRYESLPQGTRPPGESMKAYTNRISSSFERPPAAVSSGTKPLAQASDDRTLSADVERLRMLKKQLEMAKEKRDALASLAKAGGGAENWELPSSRKENIGESTEFGIDRLQCSTDVGNTGSQISFEPSGQPPVARTTILRGKPEAKTSRGNLEPGYRSEKQPAMGPQSWPPESSDFGGRWEGNYNKTRDEENSLPLQEPRFGVNWNEDRAKNLVERPTMATGRDPVTYGDSRVNRLQRSLATTSEYDDSTPCDKTSSLSGGWGVCKPPEIRPPYDREPAMVQMNPGIRGPPSEAQAWGEPFPYPENAAAQRWEGNREMAGHNMPRYPRGGFAEPGPYADECWRGDDRSNAAPRPRPGMFRKEPDVEWKAPQSRF